VRNRKDNIKIEHHLIDNLWRVLQEISALDYVKSIVPGRIKPISGNYTKTRIEFKQKTGSGIKCLAKSGRATQEVFIVTSDEERLLKFLETL
jgi:hypothetical protein